MEDTKLSIKNRRKLIRQCMDMLDTLDECGQSDVNNLLITNVLMQLNTAVDSLWVYYKQTTLNDYISKHQNFIGASDEDVQKKLEEED